MSSNALPRWADIVLLPLLNLLAAFAISALVILLIGENPIGAMKSMAFGAFGYGDGLGFTLYYATNFIFTGLSVAIAFHCGLFNIGGEGQAFIGGLGVGLVCLAMGGIPWPVVLVAAILASALFGAAWAYVPAYLQAKRGSHIVITTIMFNFIAASVMTYLLVDVLRKPGQQAPESREFDPSTWLPYLREPMGWLGIDMPSAPLNLSFLWALICCVLFYVYLWKTRWGYELRTVGHNERAAVYAGISPARSIIVAMMISGALAGFVGLNVLMGDQHRLLLGFTGGVGYVGIAVALMGRNHPVGIVLAGLLFGALYQGGSELGFDYPTITRELVVAIQGLVILFAGALENIFRPQLEALFRRRQPAPAPAE
ncbi:MAG TPA: ABC transporter permease [Alphaproteobacteria bacterium]|nr:ABC transporter permease [Alphaproteobacteria bacterium]